MKDARGKNRDGGERFAVGFGANIGSQRQLADVELDAPHHPAKRLNENRDIFIFDFKMLWLDVPVAKRFGVTQRPKYRFQFAHSHRELLVVTVTMIMVVMIMIVGMGVIMIMM